MKSNTMIRSYLLKLLYQFYSFITNLHIINKHLAPKYLISLAGSYRRVASHRWLASLHVSQKH